MYAPNLVNIAINGVKKENYFGEIHLNGRGNSSEFYGFHQMISTMESYFDKINFPMKSIEYRSFNQDKKQIKTNKINGRYEKSSQLDSGILEKKGKKASFIIHVQYRQNCTWQGRIIWLEKNEREYFRSIMEMLNLIEAALEYVCEND